MKLLIATGLYPPEIGGPATHAAFVVNELSARGFIVSVLPFSEVRKYPKVLRHALYFYKVVRMGRSADMLYVLDPVSVGLPVTLAAMLLGKPFILRVAGDYAWEQGVGRFNVQESLDNFLNIKKPSVFSVRVLKKIQTFVAQRTQHIVVPSDYFKSVIVRWGIVPEKITTVYSTLEPLSAPTKNEARTALDLDNRPVVVSAGRLVSWKGFLKLIDAFILVQKKFPTAQLRIIGSGPQYSELSERIKALNLTAPILLEGSLSQKDLIVRIAAADVFLLNTHYEGLSHQLIEVMQVGTPIITTSIPGNKELLEDGVSALLVSPDDIEATANHIDRILSDQILSRRLIAGAQTALTRFSPKVSLDALVTLFSGIQQRTIATRVLMISGDVNVLDPTSVVSHRLELQRKQVEKLDVLVRLPGESKLTAARRMLRLGKKETYDIVTAQDPFYLGFLAWRIARTSGATLQLQVHTDLFAPEFYSSNWAKVFLAKFLLRRANNIRVVSERIKKSLAPLKLSAPIAVLPVFVDLSAVEAAASIDVRALFPQFSKTILIAARLEPEKDVRVAITSMPKILQSIPDAGLLIAGAGSQKQTLEMLAHTLHLEKNVIFLGFRTDIFSLYKGVDLLLSTSRYEGYGASVVEALAVGCPVISFDTGVAREAGVTLVSQEELVGAIVGQLHSKVRGELKLSVPSQEEWVIQWRKSLMQK